MTALRRGTLSKVSAQWRLQPAEGAQAGCNCHCGKWDWPVEQLQDRAGGLFGCGRGVVSTVMDATSTASGGSQRSAASAATGAQVQTPHSFQPQPSQGTRVTVVSDNSRSPRTL